MPRMSAAVGADVESLCSKCGDVWHVVVAKVGDRIAKVQCKECGGYHRHRAPGGAQAKKATGARKRTTAAKARIDVPKVEPDLSRPARRYQIDQTYQPGERIEHPTFGTGVVEGSPGTGKIDVFFPSGRRVLAQARNAGAGLAPPPRRSMDPGE
jgi:hypothetical protein